MTMKSRPPSSPTIIIIILIISFFSISTSSFTCSGPTKTCTSLAGYVTPNTTTYAAIKSLFTVTSIRALYGANNLPFNTTSTTPIPANTTLRIPFPCLCSNSSGVSNGRPIYVVKKDDGLDLIARNLFSGLVVSRQIADANGIKDVNKIDVGQRLSVPLPCSCDDDVEGKGVVHYAHKVVAGSGLEGIAAEFGTTVATLMEVNGIKDEKQILADQILDVPLPACSSSIRNDSADSGFLAANDTYFLTANNCVQCSCSATTYQLQCRPIQRVLNASCLPVTCPSNNLILGGTLPASGCDVPTCVYEGYNNKTIFTALSNVSNCLSPGGVPMEAPEGSAATRLMVGWRGMGWMEFLVLFNVIFFSFGLK